jgi:hypothetical protein
MDMGVDGLIKSGFYPALFAKSRLDAINSGQGTPSWQENTTTIWPRVDRIVPDGSEPSSCCMP